MAIDHAARDAKREAWAPNDVMLNLLEELASQDDKADLRYVLSLLLVRRRVVRLEDTEHDELGREVSLLYCSRREVTYRVLTVTRATRRPPGHPARANAECYRPKGPDRH